MNDYHVPHILSRTRTPLGRQFHKCKEAPDSEHEEYVSSSTQYCLAEIMCSGTLKDFWDSELKSCHLNHFHYCSIHLKEKYHI